MVETKGELFAEISHGRTADEVVRQIELLLLDGVLRDGDRLPGERDLALRFDVSRPILREALKELENRGLLVSQHGGGTFVADIVGQVFSTPLTALIARHEKATRDYLEYRRHLEGLTAEMAARRATETDKALLARIVEGMRSAIERGSAEDELAADVEFHNAVGEAAHNIILLHTLRACYRLLSEGILSSRQAVFALGDARAQLLSQHVAIYQAIVAGDPAAAKAAAEAHVDFVAHAVEEVTRASEWTRVSQLRQMQRETRPLASRTARSASPSPPPKGTDTKP